MSTSPSSQSAIPAGTAPRDAMNNEVQIGPGSVAKLRNPILVVIYTIITLGIYQIYWWYSANRELADYGRARGVEVLGDYRVESDMFCCLPGGADRRTCDLGRPSLRSSAFRRRNVSTDRHRSTAGSASCSSSVPAPALVGYMQSGLNSAWNAARPGPSTG